MGNSLNSFPFARWIVFILPSSPLSKKKQILVSPFSCFQHKLSRIYIVWVHTFSGRIWGFGWTFFQGNLLFAFIHSTSLCLSSVWILHITVGFDIPYLGYLIYYVCKMGVSRVRICWQMLPFAWNIQLFQRMWGIWRKAKSKWHHRTPTWFDVNVNT